MIGSSLKKHLLPADIYSNTTYEDDSDAVYLLNPDIEYENLARHTGQELLSRQNIQKLLGRSLYWLGVPLQVLVLTRKSDLSQAIWLPPIATIAILLMGLALAYLCLQLLKKFTQCRRLPSKLTKLLDGFYPSDRAEQGSFVLASILGSTGFLGIAIVPIFVSKDYLAWVVLYGVAHNLMGSYGLGILLASYFGRSKVRTNTWQTTQLDVFFSPALWAFLFGCASHNVHFPEFLDIPLQVLASLVVPGAFLLIGMQLSQLRCIQQNLQSAIIPSAIKILFMPGLVGLAATLIGLPHDGRIVLVLMSGMPTAVVNSIVAEEYNLSRSLTTSSIVLSTVFLPLTIFLWLSLF